MMPRGIKDWPLSSLLLFAGAPLQLSPQESNARQQQQVAGRIAMALLCMRYNGTCTYPGCR